MGDTAPARSELATLGGGCFWCLDATLRELRGVTAVVSGYCGGTLPHPDYRTICGGDTGHAEVVQVTFDPEVVSFRDLLTAFFLIHDPTTKDRQGHDVGTQYRSVIFAHDAEQAACARTLIEELTAAGIWPSPIVTELVELSPAQVFWPAEADHQDYFRRNRTAAYCQSVISPKVARLRKAFNTRLK